MHDDWMDGWYVRRLVAIRKVEQGIGHGYDNRGFGGVAARKTLALCMGCRHGQSSAPLSPPLPSPPSLFSVVFVVLVLVLGAKNNLMLNLT